MSWSCRWRHRETLMDRRQSTKQPVGGAARLIITAVLKLAALLQAASTQQQFGTCKLQSGGMVQYTQATTAVHRSHSAAVLHC